ncbi:MAG TPA: hypothetical protein VH702_21335, partial [Vicinamibacterales bacterium]
MSAFTTPAGISASRFREPTTFQKSPPPGKASRREPAHQKDEHHRGRGRRLSRHLGLCDGLIGINLIGQ